MNEARFWLRWAWLVSLVWFAARLGEFASYITRWSDWLLNYADPRIRKLSGEAE